MFGKKELLAKIDFAHEVVNDYAERDCPYCKRLKELDTALTCKKHATLESIAMKSLNFTRYDFMETFPAIAAKDGKVFVARQDGVVFTFTEERFKQDTHYEAEELIKILVIGTRLRAQGFRIMNTADAEDVLFEHVNQRYADQIAYHEMLRRSEM